MLWSSMSVLSPQQGRAEQGAQADGLYYWVSNICCSAHFIMFLNGRKKVLTITTEN